MAERSEGGSSDLMYFCGKAIHLSRREPRLSNKFRARQLMDTVAVWLKCNSTPPFRVDSRRTGSQVAINRHAMPRRDADVMNRYREIVESCGGKFISMQNNVIYFFDESGSRVLSLYCAAVTPENVRLALKSVREPESVDFRPLVPTEKC